MPTKNTSKNENLDESTDAPGAGRDLLQSLSFQMPLRKYQKEIIDLCNKKLEAGEKELHIVAPPGAGKTILGFEIISQFNCPSLVLCPNNTILAQWSKKLDHFVPERDLEFARAELIGTHKDRPLKPITVMTYQALSVPGKEKEYLDKSAQKEWVEETMKSLSLSRGEAEVRLIDLERNNPRAFKKEIGRHASRLRKKLVDILDLDEVLHENALELMQGLKRNDIGLVIFDECHHLTDYWAAVMIHLVRRLDDATIVGLTGTPPEEKSAKQTNRYLNLVGEIDYQVPTPALVKEGGLAPFQDLVFFTEPEEVELKFLEESHGELHELLSNFIAGDSEEPSEFRDELIQYLESRLTIDNAKELNEFLDKKPELAMGIARYLWSIGRKVPRGFAVSDSVRQSPLLSDWINMLEDFSLNHLKTSSRENHKILYNKIKSAIRKVGYSLTERGIRKVASPVDRVLAYSKSKAKAVAKVLDSEYRYMEDRLRAVVITDFEKMSATSVRPLKDVLEEETGGAIGTFKEIMKDEISNFLNPCLVTGTTVLIDTRIKDQFLDAAGEYLSNESDEPPELLCTESGNFTKVEAASGAWTSRVYVPMVTEFFSRGITKCLIGTRGIFSEGWDCQQLNTIIDLTTSTSGVTVKQLRGRGIRLNTEDLLSERKVANNWDIVCIAPSLEKGLNDYYRFVKKHDGYFGIADDGQIECGVGHVHPQFSELTPQEVFAGVDQFNYEMLERSICREEIYDLWKVGEPYDNASMPCIELARVEPRKLLPLYLKNNINYKDHALEVRESLSVTLRDSGLLYGAAALPLAFILVGVLSLPLIVALAPILLGVYLVKRELDGKREELVKVLKVPMDPDEMYRKIGKALLSALIERKFLPDDIAYDSIVVTRRKDNFYRIFLNDAAADHSNLFVKCFEEILVPITNQDWVIPRYELSIPEEVMEDEKQFLNCYLNGEAGAKVSAYHAVPKLLARSEAGRQAFEFAWNLYVSPGFLIQTSESPEILEQSFGMGANVSERLLWG